MPGTYHTSTPSLFGTLCPISLLSSHKGHLFPSIPVMPCQLTTYTCHYLIVFHYSSCLAPLHFKPFLSRRLCILARNQMRLCSRQSNAALPKITNILSKTKNFAEKNCLLCLPAKFTEHLYAKSDIFYFLKKRSFFLFHVKIWLKTCILVLLNDSFQARQAKTDRNCF